MAISRGELAALRQGLAELPELAFHAAGQEVNPDHIFFPPSHAQALDPDAALVVGNRGVGKSFWASALTQPSARARVAEAYGRRLKLDGLRVQFGFADAEGGGNALVTKALIDGVPETTSTALIWRAVIIRHLAQIVGATAPEEFSSLVTWVKENPEAQQKIFRAADEHLVAHSQTALLVFDQLDQLAEDWERINQLTVGLLQMALAMKSYRAIRLKIFMRLDQFGNDSLFQFPDASKIKGAAVSLRWRAMELYALLYFELLRNPTSSEAFKSVCQAFSISISDQPNPVQLPNELLINVDKQKQVFEVIAGEFMGRTKTRGAPYTWIPVHLSDSRGEVSPRTFLKNLQSAAHQNPMPTESAINFKNINDGVREASDHRLTELQEDYPWVSKALEPLRGLEVPAPQADIVGRWRDGATVSDILKDNRGNRAPVDLALSSISGVNAQEDTLLNLLQEIGVVDVRKNGKIDVPDIFRVRAGIKRRGGVPPHQRKQL